MTIGTKPPAEVAIDLALVRALIEEQHPNLASLALTDIGDGWDNKLFRLGDELLVRVPRRAASAALVEHEQRWLPRLSPSLPLPIPVPVRVGRPGCGFPWSWSVVSWFAGESALVAPPQDSAAAAVALGQFLRALHQPAPRDAPHNPWRGVPLAARGKHPAGTSAAGRQPRRSRAPRSLFGSVSCRRVRGKDRRCGSTAIFTPVICCSSGGRLAAVLDFGDLAAGDPATDLSVAWMLLPPSETAGLPCSRTRRHRSAGSPRTTRGCGHAVGRSRSASPTWPRPATTS